MSKNKFYCTTPIYYVNAAPHLGTLYTTVIADVAARWNKLRGKEVFFLTGTDEHGQKIAEKAAQLNQNPKDFVDSMIPPFKAAWKHYGIEYTKFIRTTDKSHEKAVIKLIEKLMASDDVYKSTYQGFYCVPDETFVAGDVESTGGVAPLCPSCNRPLQVVEEENYFFRLSAYAEKLLEFYAANSNFIQPKEKFNEVIEFVKSGLRDLSISRKTVTWGIPFPGDVQHTVYVWGDALTNYISAVGFGSDAEEDKDSLTKWWPADVHIMGKDIVRFHGIYWPAFLMAAGLPLPKKLLVHSYILVGDTKMSKSLGNVLDPMKLADTYGVEAIRYFLMRYTSFAQDANVSLDQLLAVVNADLSNSFGNLLNRVISLALANDCAIIPAMELLEADGVVLRERAHECVITVCDEMAHYNYHIALAAVWKFIGELNAYLHEQQPWKVVKTDKKRFLEIISMVCHGLQVVSTLLSPVMPNKMKEVFSALGIEMTIAIGTDQTDAVRKLSWNKTFKLTQLAAPLFPRIEIAPKEEMVEPTAAVNQEKMTSSSAEQLISIDEFARVELLIGTIINCVAMENSKKLLKSTVDFGPKGIRQIVSGIANYLKPEDLIGLQATFVCNLPERKMGGEVSQGMLIGVDNGDSSFSPLILREKMPNGARVK
jgi:methionyl-tRNA synthetase